MAYFSNSTDGSVFDEECSSCTYWDACCPIALVQMTFNYDACNNPTARKILDYLVKQDGTCEMKQLIDSHQYTDPNQGSLPLDT